MDDMSHPESQPSEPHETNEQISPAPGRRNVRLKYVIIGIVVLLIAGGLWYGRGIFVAATVNGAPISRLSVVRESEKQSGTKALDYLITRKLIEDAAGKKGIHVSSQEISDQIKKIEENLVQQGTTLAEAMKQEGVSEDDIKTQIALNKMMDGLVGGTVTVSDDEVNKFIEDQKITFPKGADEVEQRASIKERIRQGKLSEAAQQFIATLKTQAKISYFVSYPGAQ